MLKNLKKTIKKPKMSRRKEIVKIKEEKSEMESLKSDTKSQ